MFLKCKSILIVNYIKFKSSYALAIYIKKVGKWKRTLKRKFEAKMC